MTTVDIPLRTRVRERISKEERKLFLQQNINKYLLTTRFSHDTWKENNDYLQNHPRVKCIYCSPYGVSTNIPIKTMLFVLEMNNSNNQIMGVGLVRNEPWREQECYRVYKNGYYNLTAYVGYHRLSREELSNDTIDDIKIWEELENICFKGKGHLKMGSGMTSFPIHVLHRLKEYNIDILEWLSSKFKEKYKAK